MLHAAGHIHEQAFAQLDFLLVHKHAALPFKHIVDLIRALMIVQFGVCNLEVVYLRRRAVFLFEERPDLSAGFGPRLHVCQVAAQETGCRFHQAAD